MAESDGGSSQALMGTGHPNILVILTDQQRWDTLGCYGSPMGLTPNLDALAQRGCRFDNAITNQPVCAPARGCLWTGCYATSHGVWRNGFGLSPGMPTVARCLREVGYQAGYIGKWHLAPHGGPQDPGSGAVPPELRGGFDDFWEASNLLEYTSQPFDTCLYDQCGDEIRLGGYRVDALTDRAIQFLRTKRVTPFFLAVSYLEPHQQNDIRHFVAPVGYAERHVNPFVPSDLRALPGDWQAELPAYYGCIARIDEAVGRLLHCLDEECLAEQTVVVFLSDHGCHFRTRNSEYKRSCHDSSIHIPLLISGPGFNRRLVVPEVVSIIDIAPTLLETAGAEVALTMQGRSLLPLIRRESCDWPGEALIQISESCVARALRTQRWTYCITAPDDSGLTRQGCGQYQETHLYDLYADPFQLVNLAGHWSYRSVGRQLRGRLEVRLAAVGEGKPVIREFVGAR